MIVSRYFSTIPDGNPVPNGVEVELRLHADNSLVATEQTTNGWATFVLDGSPGPHYLRCLYNSETHIVSSIATGVSATTDVGNLPLLIRTYHDGYVRGVLGELEVTAPGSAMTLTVASGAAYVRGILYDQRSAKTVSLDAPDVQPRIDQIVIEVVPPGGPSTIQGRSRVKVKKGVPASIPTPASLTQTDELYEIALAEIRVNAGVAAITQSVVTDRRSLMWPFIPDRSITSEKIAEGGITDVELADGAVTRQKIANSAVSTDQIAPGAITTQKLGYSAVITDRIANGAVTQAKLVGPAPSDENIRVAQVQTGSTDVWYGHLRLEHLANISKANPSPGDFLRFGGSTWTAADPVPAGSITATKIANRTITPGKIEANSLTASEIAPNAIGQSELNTNAVTTTHIVNGAITDAKLANNSVMPASLNSANNPIVLKNRSDTDSNTSSSGNLLTVSRSLPAGSYTWFAIGLMRGTGDYSSTLVQGWLRILWNSSEQDAQQFYLPAGPYGGSVQVMASGEFSIGSTSTQRWDIAWARESGTLTLRSRQMMVWVQRTS